MKADKITALIVPASFWPLILYWFIPRSFDGSEEAWGLLSLLFAFFFLYFYEDKKAVDSGKPDVRLESQRSFAYTLAILSLLAYIPAIFIAPHLLQAVFMILAVYALFLLTKPESCRSGILALLFLSLPLFSSLNFFLGYPMRLIVSALATLLLKSAAIDVSRQGSMLFLGSFPVSIDAPCSGVNMLYATAFLAAVFCCLYRLRLIHSIILFAGAFVFVILANVLRVAGLVFYQSNLNSAANSRLLQILEEPVHTGAGITVFIFLAVSIAFAARRLSMHSFREAERSLLRLSDFKFADNKRLFQTVLLLSVCASVLPFFAQKSRLAERAAEPVWPGEIDGRMIKALEASKELCVEERKFTDGFPGKMRRFSDGERTYLLRYVRAASRQVHPAADCYKAMGYKIEPGPLVRLKDGVASSFIAEKNEKRLQVFERIDGSDGKSFTTVSEWYWSALLGQSNGPWFDLVIAFPIGSDKAQCSKAESFKRSASSSPALL